MSFNVLEILKDQVSGGLAKEAAGFLGGSEGGITKALGTAFPAILGSVLEKGSSDSGAGELMDMIKGQDTGFMDNIGSLFGGGGGALDSLMGSGGGMLNMLMGDKLGGVVDLVSKTSGLDSGITGKVFKMAAPFLMGIIGKQVMSNGLNVGGLMDMLGGQKDSVAAAMPSGMGNLLGLGGLLKGVGNIVGGGVDAGKKVVGAVGDVGSSVTGAAASVGSAVTGAAANVGSAAIDTAAKTGSSLIKWLIPAIVVLGVLSYFFGFKTGCSAVDNVTDSAVNATEGVVSGAGNLAKDAADATIDGAKAVGNATVDGVKSVGDATANAAGAVFAKVDDAAKKAMDALTFTTGSAAAQFKSFIEGGANGSGVFKFNNLNFATGSAAIDGKGGNEVDNIAAIMKAYPGVNIQIAGHTDKTGDAAKNVTLSQNRAETVKGRLIAKGIASERLTAKGYGSSQPVSATSTNAENRRIEVRIIK